MSKPSIPVKRTRKPSAAATSEAGDLIALAGGDEIGAAELTRRVADNVRHLRKTRAYSLDDLATRSGVSRASLSQIETAKTNPTIAILWKIASGLGVPFAALLGDERVERVRVLHRNDQQVLRSADGRMESRPLMPAGASPNVEMYELRLTPRGREIGLVEDGRWVRFEERRARLEKNVATLDRTSVRLSGARVSAAQALKRPEVTLEALVSAGDVRIDVDTDAAHHDVSTLETSIKYQGYLRRQVCEVERLRRAERKQIPAEFPYERIPGLTREVVQRLSQVRPATVGQALRVPGVTPAAGALVAAFVGRFPSVLAP